MGSPLETAAAANEDLQLSGSNFISIRPDQDSLSFMAPKARYDLKKHLITANDVQYIQVADALVTPDSMRVRIRRNAEMDPLTNAVITANFVTKHHRIYNATVDIRAKRNYSATGDYAYDLLDATNSVVGGGTGTWTAGSPISVNGFELQLDGVPRNGDVINIEPTSAPLANNGNALAFIALGSSNFVGITTLAGGEIPGRTITDAYANALSDIGVRVQSAKTASSISDSIATTADSTLANRTGVNLDEEAARLIQFQQSYQAAARMLQIAQNVFDALLDAAGS